MSPCLGNLDGPRWRAAVFIYPIRAARQRGSPEVFDPRQGQERQNRSETRNKLFRGVLARPEHVEEKWEPVFRPDMR